MRLLRIGIGLLLCAATVSPSWSDEKADRLVTAFARICLAKPDSMKAIGALAKAQGLALDQPGAAALAKPENAFNLLLHWTSATDSRMRLTGIIAGESDGYELGCVLDGYDAPLLGVLVALKPILGKPTTRTVKESKWIELGWPASGNVTLSYNEGEQKQRITLTLVQLFGKWAKPK